MNDGMNVKGVLTEMIGWHKGRLILTALLLMSMLVICVCAYDTGDLIQNFQYPGHAHACAGSGVSVWVDTDGIDNGGPIYGYYDTMVVFWTISGEGARDYLSPPFDTWMYFFSSIKCNYEVGDPLDKGRFVIRFVDMLAPGFDPLTQDTWTYKSVPRIIITSMCNGDPASEVTDPALMNCQVRGYREIPATGSVSYLLTGNPEHFDGISERQYDFSDPAGIKELVVTTDYSENDLWKFHIITGETLPLSIDVTDSQDPVNSMTPYTYTIGYTFTMDEGSATIIDQLPPEVSFISATGGGIYDSATHSVHWEVSQTSGSSVSVTVIPHIPVPVCGAPPPPSVVIQNTATISYSTESATDTEPTTILVLVPVGCVPEFPSILLPSAMIIGFLGTVLFIKRTRKH